MDWQSQWKGSSAHGGTSEKQGLFQLGHARPWDTGHGHYEGWGAYRNESDLLSSLTTKVAAAWNMSTKVVEDAAVLIMVDDTLVDDAEVVDMAVAEEEWNKMIRIK